MISRRFLLKTIASLPFFSYFSYKRQEEIFRPIILKNNFEIEIVEPTVFRHRPLMLGDTVYWDYVKRKYNTLQQGVPVGVVVGWNGRNLRIISQNI